MLFSFLHMCLTVFLLQAAPEYRVNPEDLLKLFVKNDGSDPASFSTLFRLERVCGPEQLTRYNMYTSSVITGDAAPGYSSGQAIEAIERVAKEVAAPGFDHQWSGITREQIMSGNRDVYIFIICLVVVYLLSAAEYERFLLPLPVILLLPTGIFGAFLFQRILSLENNIYAQVALVIASGAGAINNRLFGTAAGGQMLTGTEFGHIVIPGRYVLIGSIGKGRRNPKKKIVSGKKLFFPMKPYNRFAQARIWAVILLFIVVLACSSGCAPMKELQPAEHSRWQ